MEKWGLEFQLKVAIEELAELIVELAKYGRKINGSTVERIAAEVADGYIMLGQITSMFMINDLVAKIKQQKLKRLEKLLSE